MTEHTHEVTDFRNWLRRYGAAWEAKDSKAFSALFSEDVAYYWTPFEEPKQGRHAVGQAFAAATSTQQEISFSASILSIGGRIGTAHWTCSLTRIETGAPVLIDGILLARFDDTGKCQIFREWWHSNERDAAEVSDAVASSRGPEDVEDALLGTWKLESWTAEDRDGIETRPFGFETAGTLTYSHGHRVSVQIMRTGRDRFEDDSALGGTSAEAEAAYRGFLAYAGTYEVDTEGETVTHRVETSSFPNWEGSEQVRHFKLEGDVLEMSTPPIEASDPTEGPLRHRLHWRRITSGE